MILCYTVLTYYSSLDARYPHVGPRDFEDALHSERTSLRPAQTNKYITHRNRYQTRINN